MNGPVITVQNCSKRFVMNTHPLTAFSLCRHIISRSRQCHEIWALKDVCLDVAAGDRIGIIGDNGSGKSTLLRILAGLYRPTRGTVRVRSDPAAFLQTGIGMERDLNARDNIFLFGAIMGVPRKKIRECFDDIVRFAEIEDHIDCPLRDFSSGMVQRVAFAIARLVDTDILLLDEMLASGDIGFRNRCYRLLDEYVHASKTIIMTSHETEMIRLFCNKCLWLDKGVQKAFGPADAVLNAYAQSKAPVLTV